MSDENSKPDCQLIGTDGNVLALASTVANCMRKNDMDDKVDEMMKRVFNSRYPECYKIFRDYVNIC